MAVLRNGLKCSHTTCMLRFFTVSRLALNPNRIFEIGSNSPGRFFHYEPLFTSSFSKNLIIPEAIMFSKGKSVATLQTLDHL